MSATSVERIESPVGVSAWPPYPTSYEINTWVWLAELSQKHGGNVDLSSVPSAEWDAIAAYGFDSVWLMGVWERSRQRRLTVLRPTLRGRCAPRRSRRSSNRSAGAFAPRHEPDPGLRAQPCRTGPSVGP